MTKRIGERRCQSGLIVVGRNRRGKDCDVDYNALVDAMTSDPESLKELDERIVWAVQARAPKSPTNN